jgi:hypothetical protein
VSAVAVRGIERPARAADEPCMRPFLFVVAALAQQMCAAKLPFRR